MTMTLTQVTTGGVDENINIDSNTLKVDGTNNRVGIGAADVNAPLEVRSSSALQIRTSTGTGNYWEFGRDDSTGDFFLADDGLGTVVAVDQLTGNVGIGTALPSRLLTIQSTGNANFCIKSANTGVSQCMFGDTDSDVAGNITYRHSENAMTFEVNSSERMRIDSSGAISTDNSAYAYFRSDSTTNTSLTLKKDASGADGVDYLQCRNTANSLKLVIEGDGDVKNVNNSYGSVSDSKLKENIVDASSQWSDIKNLQVRNYNFTEASGYSTHTQIGLIAQEVETVSPGLVNDKPDVDEDGNDLGTVTKSVNYSVLYMKAVKALQEAINRIETLETKVAALEAQ